jgi:hypothetical protein
MLVRAIRAGYTLHELRSAAFKRFLACGSMVLAVLSVFLFSLCERKKKHKRK